MTDSCTDEYREEAWKQDDILDARLTEIRRQTDAREITLRMAADARVAALEAHIEAIRSLRSRFFGEEMPEDEDE